MHFVFSGGTISAPIFSSISFGRSQSLVHSASILIDNCSFLCHRPLTVQLGNGNLTLSNIRAVGCHSNQLPALDITLTESVNCYISDSHILGYNFAAVITTNICGGQRY